MRKLVLLILLSFNLYPQSYKIAFGNNITSYVFTNSSGINPTFLKPASGLNLNIIREAILTKNFHWDGGIVYSQLNTVGDVQNIPISYNTDFIGVSSGIGPKLKFSRGINLLIKANLSLIKMINGNQFLLNHYVDLNADEQFSSVKAQIGYSFEINKSVNNKMNVFVKYQHMDSFSFGSSTLNFIPSTFSIGLEIAQ